ncbi:fibroblast growth factor receptor 4-like [Patiria miniata]|uniref:receptor protein-tyrosine kinase n=1 Tax=Patiria miniata TaxID=46514 RepID=A0A913Z1E1_PATMI|nr:fibroblast growth factor receptor 4-like [Patiria miniata]XP_038045709.1 fibroblast growth factor receptor 4-like [Patiria miniata]
MDSRGQYKRLVLHGLLILSLVSLYIGSDAASPMDTPDKIATRPVISDMVDQEVSLGSTVTFDCQVMSLTAPTFEWWKADNSSGKEHELGAIPDKIDIIVHNTPLQENVYTQMLRIYGVILEDAGSYKCTAGNNLGTSSESALLTVHEVSRPFMIDMNNQEVSIGSTVTFDCQVMSSTAPSFEWWKIEESGCDRELRAIPDKMDILVNTPLQEDVYSQTLRIYSLSLEDAGSYTCTASNNLGTSSESSLLSVNEDSRPFMIDMNNQEVSVGSTVTFDCQVMSSTAPSFEWWKTDESGSDRELRAFPDKMDILVNTPSQENVYSQTLRIYRVTLKDAGSYICISGNDLGTSSESSLLTVNKASRPFMIAMENKEVIVGSIVTFDCQVMSSTEPAIHWWKTDQSGDTYELSAIQGEIDILNPSQRENVHSLAFRIYSVTSEDAGTYTCIAGNNRGTSTEEAELTIITPELKPTTSGAASLHMKFGAPGTLALTLMAVCGYAFGNHLFFD